MQTAARVVNAAQDLGATHPTLYNVGATGERGTRELCIMGVWFAWFNITNPGPEY